jgi:hypothetical protein
MAIAVKDVTASAQKFVQRAQAAGGDYSAGVSNAGGKWAANTKGAAQTWSLGVQQAITDGRYANGINQNSQSKYQTRASTVGAQRYPTGVAGAQQSWAAGVTPYLQTISNLNLPPRQPKGSAANYQRVQAVGDALRAKKLGTGA